MERKHIMVAQTGLLCKEQNVQLDSPLSTTDSCGGKGKLFRDTVAKKRKGSEYVKSEVKAEVKTEVKCEVKAEIKPEVKADNVKRRNVKRPKTDSFGDGGRSARFMGNPDAERARLEIKHQTHLPSNKKSAEPEKTHKLGEMSGPSRDVEVSNL